MFRNQTTATELRPHPKVDPMREESEPSGPRTIVIHSGSAWQSLAFLCLCLLLLGITVVGQRTLAGIDRQNQDTSVAMAAFERKVERIESGLSFQSKRRHLVLGMRDHILRVNPHVSLGDAYRYAQLAVEASEKYPAVDPLLLLSIGTIESGYDPHATSHADARGLYQIWPSTGRLLLRSLGWNYEEGSLYDPEKNTEAAALYLDILFSTYNDPQLVLAEYNGGPLNAGYYRAHVSALADETRNYVPRVLQMYERLKTQFDKGAGARSDLAQRDGNTLSSAMAAARPPTDH